MTTEVPVKIRVDGLNEAEASFNHLGGVISEALAIAGIAEFAKKGMEEFSKIQTASNELTAALHHQSLALIELGRESAKTSTFRTPEIIQGEKVLSTYKLTEAQIKQLLPALLNLSVRTGSVSSAARMLGMSFENGSSRLGMFGINVNGAVGSQERLESIINKTNSALGDQNKAAFDAMNPLAKMSKSMDEIAESMGKAVSPEVEKFSKFLSDHQESLGKFAEFVGSHIEILGLATISLGIAKAAPVIIGGLKAIRTEITLNPFAALAIGLGLAANAIADFWAASSDKKATDAIKEGNAATEKAIEDAKFRVKELKRERDAGLITAETYKELTKMKLAFLRAHETKKESAGGGGLSSDQLAEIEQEKAFQAKVQALTEKIKDEHAESGKSDVQIQLDKEYNEYQKSYQLLLAAGDDYHSAAIEALKDNYFAKVSKINKEQSLKELKELDKKYKGEQKLEDDAIKKKEQCQKKFYQFMEKDMKKSFVTIKHHYKEDRVDFAKELEDKNITQKQYDTAMIKLNTDAYADYAETALSSMSMIADATKANAQVKKRIAEGEAIISAGKAALGVLENSGGFLKAFGPVAGYIMEGLELAGITAEAVMQVQKIEGAKMAYGGVLRGGIPGRDSVPVMGMPGEIMYNPAHPNPALAAMISQNAGSTTTSTETHIHMGSIIVNGNADKRTQAAMQDAVDKGLTSALRKAINSGKISANGLVVRN